MTIDRATYHRWIQQFDTLTEGDLEAARRFAATLDRAPAIDVAMPVYDPPEQFLRAAIASVREQIYPKWTLCIHDDASTKGYVTEILNQAAGEDPRIRVSRGERNLGIAGAYDAAVALGSGEFVTFLDHDDLLRPHALLMIAECVVRHPEANLIHCDGDLLDGNGERFSPFFKPVCDPDLLRAYNIMWGTFRRELLSRLGGMRRGYPGSEDHDLTLRAVEAIPAETVRHVPHVLGHWRMVPTSFSHTRMTTAMDASRRAVHEHCERLGIRANVSAAPRTIGWNRVRAAPDPAPRVLVVVENAREGEKDALRARYSATTSYPSWALHLGPDDGPVTGPARNDLLRHAEAELVAFVDGRLRPRNPDWLTELTSHFSFASCAAVGARIMHGWFIEQCGTLLGVREPGSSLPVARAFHGMPEDTGGACGRAELAHRSSAVTGGLILVERTRALDAGGFDGSLPGALAIDLDFCLRAGARGGVFVTTPHAVFDAERPGTWFEDGAIVATLRERWGARLGEDPFYNPNLTDSAADFGLAWPPRVQFPWRTT